MKKPIALNIKEIYNFKKCLNPIHSACDCRDIHFEKHRMCRLCRPKARPYRFHFVCFNCRRGWKQMDSNYFHGRRNIDCCFNCEDTILPINPCLWMNRFCEEIHCSKCHFDVFVAGYDLRIPKHNNVKEWKLLEKTLTTIQLDVTFMNCCRITNIK